ncbi:MAG: polysaccharide biosynthesis protein, partial [Lachnospiraceae bacterium]|nr:polysaccharide biosynthesis protein [Lachnospiraceae bacterium]
ANCCINCFLFPNRKALLAAFQREDICGRMHIVTYVVLYSVQIISVCLVKSYYLYAIMVPISSIIYSSLCAYKSKQIFGQYYEDGEIDDQTKKDIKKQVAGLMVRKIASYSRDAFDSMFVSAYLGLKAVAIYGNYYYVMDAVVILIGVIKTSMAGGIGNSIAMETVEKNHNDMKIINYMFMLISGWCAICLLCLYQPFMKIWVGEDMTLSFYFSILFAAYFYVLRMSDIRILYAEAIGIWWQGRYLSIIEAVANVLMNWIFIRHFGLLGIILSTMISFFLFNFIGGAIIIYIYYFKGCKISGYFMAQLKYLIVTLIVASVTCYATSLLNVNGIIEIIVKGIFCVVIPAVLYFLFYARTEDFKKARLLITQMLGIKKNK